MKSNPRTKWPLLDADTKAALVDHSVETDLHPECVMLALGGHLPSTLSTEDLQKWLPVVMEGTPPDQPRAELVALLAYGTIQNASEWPGLHDLEYSARLLMMLTLKELQEGAEESGLDSAGSKVEIVVCLEELLNADLLVVAAE